MTDTMVYIDGLNLYYQALKWSPHKWLNLEALATAALPPHCNLVGINYYYANVSGRVDPDAPKRQQAYLRALKSTPSVVTHKGNFLFSEIWTGLVFPFHFRPVPILTFHWPRPIVGLVHKTEEKGSDVNLGAHLVRDAFQGKFKTAAVLTNDTDLKEPIRIVVQELGLPVILLTPVNNPAKSLRDLVSDIRDVRPHVGLCQFPPQVILPNGQQANRPRSWATAAPPRTKRRIRALDAMVKRQKPITAFSTAGITTGSFWVIDTPLYFGLPISLSVMLSSIIIFSMAFGLCRQFRGY